jgi:site-specific recombinase XerD
MKNEDFGAHLTRFLSYHLPEVQNLSQNTISSYCDTFRLLLSYCQDIEELKIETLKISDISCALVERFMGWLSEDRKIAASTQNQRLAAIHSFVRYIQADFPALLLEFNRILSIKSKKTVSKTVDWLTVEEMGLILSQPDAQTQIGRRNITILSLLYDTAARVSEICELKVRDIRLEHPAHARLFGKGRKVRLVPLLPATVKLLEAHLKENRLDTPDKSDYPLFVNRDGEPFTRAGIRYILKKAADSVTESTGKNLAALSPHVIRHTKAMHIYDAGANLVYVRDILGHSDIKTTSIYARTSLEKKRQALAQINNAPEPALPEWTKDANMLNWLKEYGKIRRL